MTEKQHKQVDKQKKFINKTLKSEQGQALVEYALLIVLMAFVTVLAMQSLGIAVSNSFTMIDNALVSATKGSYSPPPAYSTPANPNGNSSGNLNNNGNNGNNGNSHDNNGQGVGKKAGN